MLPSPDMLGRSLHLGLDLAISEGAAPRWILYSGTLCLDNDALRCFRRLCTDFS